MKSEIKNRTNEAQPKWQSITSFILGFISALTIVDRVFIDKFIQLDSVLAWIFFFIYLTSWLFGAASIILGIIGLKYSSRPFAIAGMVLSLIGLAAFIDLHNFIRQMGRV